MDVLLGIDVGTSSVKVVAMDLHGKTLEETQKSYTLHHPRPGWSEIDPEVWWQQTISAVRLLVQKLSLRHRTLSVQGVGLTGQMHSLVLVDEQGVPVRPAITWLDTRARGILPGLAERLETAGFLERIKNTPAPGLTIAILAWLVENEPESLRRARTILLAKDYIRLRLTGEIMSDPTDASSTLVFDTETRSWFYAAAEHIGVPSRLFPPLRDTWEPGETIRAEELGLPESHKKIPLSTGCSDQQAAALDTGVIHPGTMQLMLGTGAQVVAPVTSTEADTIRTLNFFAHHQGWIVQGSVQNAGSCLAWMMRVLGADWAEVAQAASAPVTKGAPFFLPYLSGERTPIMDPDATGAWIGLRNSAERSDLIRACLEGIVFGVVDALDAVQTVLGHDERADVRVSGGGTRFLPYTQMIADLFNRPLTVVPETNATGRGAAILGGIAGGLISDLTEGNALLGTRPEGSLAPDPSRHEALRERRYALAPVRDAYLQSSRATF